ncbi:acyl-CoA thioesterase [Dactylosporangium sp. AC04546]|uniref:acyl-CoA thioesterase n=1 Tax=Dactylosporangium sp. AC04546 TaxID=2862460 RepID=UPI001EDFAA1B|nr:acyl-CoA thioesterase [Dactylosporangium sp. AC04546]WVK83008.1 acyl-CoA thioesterase [Dactylosporangium sp. AC04546]
MTEHTGRSPSRPTGYSRVTLSRIMTAVDVNLYGTVHGGVIMKFVDDVAGAAAARHSGGTAVTASIDEIVFLEPLRVGDLVHAFAQVNWTGHTSMEVGVRLVAERWDEVAEEAPVVVATAYLVFVAVDAEGRPRRVPMVVPDSPENEGRWREAEIRREHRLARREAIQAHRMQKN